MARARNRKVRLVEPIPETARAFSEMLRYGDGELAAVVLSMGRRVRQLVPECIGLSVSLVEDGVTFTLVSSSAEVAAIDAVQYIDGGPCVDAIKEADVLEAQQPDVLDEGRWLMYAKVTAAAGVLSSLSLPIESGGEIVGGINLYASTADAFTGLHDRIAEELGAQAEGAVTNADLEFRSRQAAVEAPTRLADRQEVEVAVGILAAGQDVDIETARARLEAAAARAGISVLQAARAVRFVRGG
jgi:GAF domain-containing protein